VNLVYQQNQVSSSTESLIEVKNQPAYAFKVKKMSKPKKEKKPRADEPLHALDGDVDTDEPVTEFRAKVNKWGFISVPKKARSFLPFKIEEPLTVRIDGEHLTIAAATKSQPEEPRPSA
jgi:hypothetical protein